MSPAATSFPKSDIRILLLEGINPTAVATLHDAGYTQITRITQSLSEEALSAELAQTHLLGIRSRTQLNQTLLAKAKRLIGIGCFCIGTNQVDLAAAAQLGIPVFNAPYSNTRSVAELVIAETIALLRQLPRLNAQCHRGQWSKSAQGSVEARGKILGIVGYGHIGTQVGVLAEALGMQVLFYDIQSKLSLGNARAASHLAQLLAQADVVTLHVPQTPQTHHLINAQTLAQMKRGAHLINAARGDVVVIEDLAQALAQGQLAGAAIDVYPVEPESNQDALQTPLSTFDNVILTPHVGGSTQEAQANIGIEVAAKLVRYSDNGSTLSAVNFPEVNLPEHPYSLRLLHIHRNAPGVLSQINALFSQHAVNIDGQYLRTDASLGYVVIDITADIGEALALKESLAAIPGTLRTRVLY